MRAPAQARAGGNDELRLRGAMIPTAATATDLRDLAALGANSVRWQLMWGGFPSALANTQLLSAYATWLDETLRHLDTMLPVCRALGLRVVLDLHTPPGGQDPDGQWRLFQRPDHQAFFIECWRSIARRYRGDTTLWAFDLLNEPPDVPKLSDSLLSWPRLALAAGQAIREQDPARRLMVQAAPTGSSRALAAFSALPLRDVVYSFHLYDPVAFTHQGLFGDTVVVRYPGKAYGARWNRRYLSRWLQPVMKWQANHRVPIYVGEFGAVRWAPGRSAYRYLRDCIGIFEKARWHWTYHAWRESHVWSVEHSGNHGDDSLAANPTQRLQLLRKNFQRNAR